MVCLGASDQINFLGICFYSRSVVECVIFVSDLPSYWVGEENSCLVGCGLWCG